MAKYELKTKKNHASVKDFIASIDHDGRRKDAEQLLTIFKDVTKMKPKMWGKSIIGFGSYHYKYASGQEGDWMLTGFSPRKANLSLYMMTGIKNHPELLEKLGKYKTGVSCLYINKLDDVSIPVLRKIIAADIKEMKKRYES